MTSDAVAECEAPGRSPGSATARLDWLWAKAIDTLTLDEMLAGIIALRAARGAPVALPPDALPLLPQCGDAAMRLTLPLTDWERALVLQALEDSEREARELIAV